VLDDGEYIVFSITGKRVTNELGDVKVTPLVIARKHRGTGVSSVISFTGAELEAIL
jgi:hypothetical protein